jgi:hypothetical protein
VRSFAIVALLAATARADPEPLVSPAPDPPIAAPAPKEHNRRTWRIAGWTSLVTGIVLGGVGATLIALNGTCMQNTTPCSSFNDYTVIGAPLAAFGAAGVVVSIPFLVLGYGR